MNDDIILSDEEYQQFDQLTQIFEYNEEHYLDTGLVLRIYDS